MIAESFSEAEKAHGRQAVTDFLRSKHVIRLFDYWCAKRAGRDMPARLDIDPIEIPWALSRIFLIDFEPPRTFRYRLAGQEITEIFGAGMKGCTLEDIHSPDACERVTTRWMNLVDTRSVLCMKGLVYLPKDRIPMGERILLPLAEEDGGPVSGLVGMTVCEWVPGPRPPEHKLADMEIVPAAFIE